MTTVIVHVDGTGTYRAGESVYRDLPAGDVASVVGAWADQDDVQSILVVPEPVGTERWPA